MWKEEILFNSLTNKSNLQDFQWRNLNGKKKKHHSYRFWRLLLLPLYHYITFQLCVRLLPSSLGVEHTRVFSITWLVWYFFYGNVRLSCRPNSFEFIKNVCYLHRVLWGSTTSVYHIRPFSRKWMRWLSKGFSNELPWLTVLVSVATVFNRSPTIVFCAAEKPCLSSLTLYSQYLSFSL